MAWQVSGTTPRQHKDHESAAKDAMALPDLLLIGAPEGGTGALRTALATHPGVFMSSPSAPGYFQHGDAAPPAVNGPGDLYRCQQVTWQRDRYEALFDDAVEGTLRGESTPYYLWHRGAHLRIAEAVPDARLIVVLRDPVERAYSNWALARSNGFEPIGDLDEAIRLERERAQAGWCHSWGYAALGRYGEQLKHLYRHFPREQVLTIRYRDLVDQPAATLGQVGSFLSIDPAGFGSVASDEVSAWVPPSSLGSILRRAIRSNDSLRARLPRPLSSLAESLSELPLHTALRRGRYPRPELSRTQRRHLARHFADDLDLLEDLTGWNLDDWRGVPASAALG